MIEKHEHLHNSADNGSFLIKSDYAGGIYKLKAYTSWQTNWGEEAFFTKEITVQKVITPRLLLKLDFEKKAYGAGDTVSAKLKVTDLNDRKTTGSIAKSTVRIGGIAVQTLENETAAGEATVQFRLPHDLNTSDGILQVVVTDKGTEESITRSIPIVLHRISISFYPEGGDMVENVPAKVAFEALNEFGKGADVSGNIVDEKGETVASFESFHFGMGAVSFTPQPGARYFAKITKPQGDSTLHPLPQALKSGYTLHLQSKTTGRLKWNICMPENGTVVLAGQSNGQLHYNQQLTLTKGINTVEVDTKNFSAGTAVFTLFDGKNREVCERLVFLNADKGLNIKIEPDKEVYDPGEYAKVNIVTTDKDGNPVSANIGLAVVDEQLLTLADDKQDNLISYLLFSSELKGRIHEPYFYVDPAEPKAAEALDYLMLTHGWRRFSWTEVLKSTTQITELPENTTRSVYGYVLDEEGEPASAEVFLIEPYSSNGKTEISGLQTTIKGHFVFHNVDVSQNVFITTKLPNQIYLFKGRPAIDQTIDKESAGIAPSVLNGEEYAAIAVEQKPAPQNEPAKQEEKIEADFPDYSLLRLLLVIAENGEQPLAENARMRYEEGVAVLDGVRL